MLIAIKIIGILIIAEGLAFIARPDFVKTIIAFFKKGNRLYIGGVVRLAFAIIFLLGASETKHKGIIIIALGILILIGGILNFSMKLEKQKHLLEWFENKPLIFCRLMGLIALLFGSLIIYAS